MNTCGGCTACCQTVPVKEIGVRQYTTCPHVREAYHVSGAGCGIYAKRPYACRAWSCVWLTSTWALELRPDRLGVVVEGELDLIRVNGKEMPAAQMWALPGHDDDWQRPEVGNIIKAAIDQQGVAVIWRMKGGDSIGFWRDPKTVKYGRGERQPCDSTALGSDGERFLRADEIYARQQRRGRYG